MDGSQGFARRELGRTGVEVTSLGFGTAPLAGLYRAANYDEAEATLLEALDRGVRYFDTAPMYGRGKAEHVLGHVLRNKTRERCVVSTKAGRLLRPLLPGQTDNSATNDLDSGWVEPLPFAEVFDYSYDGIMRSIEASQHRTGLARLDIIYIHDIGRLTHGERHDHHWNALTKGGGLRALGELRSAGWIGAVGLGVNEWQVIRDVMEEFDLDCSMLAGRYTLLEQEPLETFLPKCAERNVSIIVGGPFNSGILAARPGEDMKFNYADAPPEVIARVRALADVCESFGVPLPQAAIQFPLAHPAVVSVVPGARSRDKFVQIADWLQAETPAELWSALKDKGLIHADAPTPS